MHLNVLFVTASNFPKNVINIPSILFYARIPIHLKKLKPTSNSNIEQENIKVVTTNSATLKIEGVVIAKAQNK